MAPYVRDSLFGFPQQEKPTISHWLRTVQGDPLLDHRSTPELPLTADIVIVGSGLTGTLIAKHAIETWPDRKIVVLEARAFCSGATGRNAGHCKPDQWRGFSRYEESFGTEQALKILQNEQQTWQELVSYVRNNNVDCELWEGDTLDVPIAPEAATVAEDSFKRFKAAGGRVDHIKVVRDTVEASKVSRVKDAQACYAWPASTLHPWKLTAHIMRENLSKGINLQTNSPVISVTPSPLNVGKWHVNTDRGSIECSKVVHATNAYSSALEPSLRGLISPIPHICNKLAAPLPFQGDGSLKNSYGILLPGGGLISINPRRDEKVSILFGGRGSGHPEFVRWLNQHPERCADDAIAESLPITAAVQEFVNGQLIDWAPTSPETPETWSGVIAQSLDGVPFIGELPGHPGQWICAGHNGHGMARIFTAAPGLVKLMDGSTWGDTQLPEVFHITESRVKRLKSPVVEDPNAVTV